MSDRASASWRWRSRTSYGKLRRVFDITLRRALAVNSKGRLEIRIEIERSEGERERKGGRREIKQIDLLGRSGTRTGAELARKGSAAQATMKTYSRKKGDSPSNVIIHVNELCRLCLAKEEEMVPIYEDETVPLPLRILACVNIEVGLRFGDRGSLPDPGSRASFNYSIGDDNRRLIEK